MITRLHLEDWRIIGHYLGVLILLVAIAMIPPFIMSLCLSEFSTAVDFLLSIGITGIVGSVLLFSKVELATLDWRQSLVITGLCWVVLSVFGALPLWMSGHYDGYLDAFFESVSAFTTTGMSLCVDVDHMALSLSVWRCLMHLIGGIGVVVIALALGVFGTGSAAASLYHAEARMGQVMPGIKQTSQFILKLAAVVVVAGTLVCIIPLLAVGTEPLRAVINGFLVTAAAFSTGGMTSSASGIIAFHSWPLEVCALVLAAFGCINFVLYGDIWKGIFRNFFKDIEIRTIFVWVTLLAVLMAFALAGSYFTTTGGVVRRGLFEVLSGGFNLGFSTLQGGQILFAMGSGALFVIILSMTICGSSSSASGGIKALRIGIIARSVVQAIREALAPDRARPRTFYFQKGRHRLTPELVSSAMIIFLLYMVTYAVGAIAGIAYGYEALPAIFDSVSAASNTGLSLGVAAPGMPNGLEIIYIFEMWLGRLEFIAILAMVVEMLAFLVPHRRSKWVRRKK
ncbi:MAG TPA: TrkH family potassium uptake protein [Coriobacteriaceae bacterium]|nr:TrkH family potassium uptake protein [Coriobacteriaceae bacterium]